MAAAVMIWTIENTRPILAGSVISWMKTVSAVAMIGKKKPAAPMIIR